MKSADDLEQLHRLERLGWLAAGLTHDLNNVLVIALAEAEALDRLLREAARALHARSPMAAAVAVESASRSLASLRAALNATAAESRELQGAYRKEEPPGAAARSVDLGAAVEKAARLVRPRVRMPIELAVPAPVRAALDEGAVVRVVVNLLLNAAEAFPPDAADPRIEARVTRVSGWSVCDVSDSGPGVAPEVAARLFEPFVTVKPAGHGMGLGLFVSRHLLRAAGGDLRLLSTGPTGTVFRVLLPPGDGEAAPAPPE